MGLSLLIFDCDGVILESMDVKTRAFERIGNDFGKEMGERLAMYHAINGGVSRYEKFEWLYRMVYGRSITPDESAVLNGRFVDYALEEIATSPLVAGTCDVLERWQGRVPMYVASGAPQEELVFLLEKRGLGHYFNGIYGSPPSKGPLLLKILQETGSPPEETLMIGDSAYDLRAAEQAGTLFYGRGGRFKYGPHPWHEDLTRLNDYLEHLKSTPEA